MLLSVKKKIGGIVIKVSTNLSWPKREKGERETEEEREKEKCSFEQKQQSRKKKKRGQCCFPLWFRAIFLSFQYQLWQCKIHFKLKRYTKSLISIVKRKISIVKLYVSLIILFNHIYPIVICNMWEICQTIPYYLNDTH